MQFFSMIFWRLIRMMNRILGESMFEEICQCKDFKTFDADFFRSEINYAHWYIMNNYIETYRKITGIKMSPMLIFSHANRPFLDCVSSIVCCDVILAFVESTLTPVNVCISFSASVLSFGIPKDIDCIGGIDDRERIWSSTKLFVE